VGPRGGLDAVVKRKTLSPCRESNPGRPSTLSATPTETEECDRSENFEEP